MEFIGQAVPHRDLCIFCQIFHDLLSVSAVLDSVKHACQNTRCIRNTFLLTDLGSAGIQICGRHTEVVCGDLKSAAGAGAGLFKDQGDVFSLAVTVCDPLFLFLLEVGGEVDQAENLFGGIVKKFQEVSVFKVYHSLRPFQ